MTCFRGKNSFGTQKCQAVSQIAHRRGRLGNPIAQHMTGLMDREEEDVHL
jgi:hypothetical protein